MATDGPAVPPLLGGQRQRRQPQDKCGCWCRRLFTSPPPAFMPLSMTPRANGARRVLQPPLKEGPLFRSSCLWRRGKRGSGAGEAPSSIAGHRSKRRGLCEGSEVGENQPWLHRRHVSAGPHPRIPPTPPKCETPPAPAAAEGVRRSLFSLCFPTNEHWQQRRRQPEPEP